MLATSWFLALLLAMAIAGGGLSSELRGSLSWLSYYIVLFVIGIACLRVMWSFAPLEVRPTRAQALRPVQLLIRYKSLFLAALGVLVVLLLLAKEMHGA